MKNHRTGGTNAKQGGDPPIHTYIHIHVYLYVYIYIYVYVYDVYIYRYIYIYEHIYTYIYISICTSMYICISISRCWGCAFREPPPRTSLAWRRPAVSGPPPRAAACRRGPRKGGETEARCRVLCEPWWKENSREATRTQTHTNTHKHIIYIYMVLFVGSFFEANLFVAPRRGTGRASSLRLVNPGWTLWVLEGLPNHACAYSLSFPPDRSDVLAGSGDNTSSY